MNTNRKGNISESQILKLVVQMDCHVLLPFGDGVPYDLAVDVEGQLLRVQVKTGRLRNGCVIFSLLRHSGRHGKGRKYEKNEFDLFAVYCPDNDQAYLLPATLGQRQNEGRLRVEPTKNNQQRKIRQADEFVFEVFLGKLKDDLVELRGLEPLASAMPLQRSSKLSYSPTLKEQRAR